MKKIILCLTISVLLILASCSLEVSVNKDDSVNLNFVYDLKTEYESLVENYKLYCNKLNSYSKKENAKIDYFKSDNIYITLKINDINLFDDYSCLTNFKKI